MITEESAESSIDNLLRAQRPVLLFLVAFFLVQNNFFLTHLLSVRGGIGLGRLRAGLLLVMMFLGGCLVMFRIAKKGFVRRLRVDRADVLVLAVLVCATVSRVSIDMAVSGQIDPIGLSPLVEGLYIAAFLGIVLREPLVVRRSFIHVVALVVFANIAVETLYYVVDIANGMSYGPFRANIGGAVINRNPSFFYPVIALALLRFQKTSPVLRVLFQVVFVAYLISLFYRTLYVALAVPFVVDVIRHGEFYQARVSRNILRGFVTVAIMAALLYQANDFLTKKYNVPIVELAYSRFKSVTFGYSNEVAKMSRVQTVPTLLAEVLLTPEGKGFNQEVEGSQIYNYAMYPLHPVLYLGWVAVIGYLWVLVRFRELWRQATHSYAARVSVFLLLYYAVILVLFPYMTYFTFLSAIASLLMINVRVLPEGNLAKAEILNT